MSSDRVVLEYNKHRIRLTELQNAVLVTIRALQAESSRVDERLQEQGEIKSNIEELHKKLVEQGIDRGATVDEITQSLRRSFFPESTQQVTINFGLVGLCTELEVFISHLVRAILRQQPRLLKSIASQKNLTTNEILDLGTYPDVVSRLHDKVVKEIIDSSARDMILRHLGERLGLFAGSDIVYDVAKTSWWPNLAKMPPWRNKLGDPPAVWGLQEIESAFNQRHDIVHEGKLPLKDAREFNQIALGFQWLVTFLSVKAVDKFGLQVDDPLYRLYAAMYGVTSSLDTGQAANIEAAERGREESG
jgi:hypothetical protein